MALQGSTEGFTTSGLVVSLFYMLGVTLLVFHFANGLWTAAITWGVTITEKAQKRWGVVCAGLGAAMMLAGWSAVIGFATARRRGGARGRGVREHQGGRPRRASVVTAGAGENESHSQTERN